MLSLASYAVAFNAGVPTSLSTPRVPAVSMIAQDFVSSRKPIALGAPSGRFNDDWVAPGDFKLTEFSGKVVPTGAVKTKSPKNFVAKFLDRQSDSSQGPPCGVAHHQGSGTST